MEVSSGKNDQVVCRLMDFKKEEYRKTKLKKANAKRIQKKKEIRLGVRAVDGVLFHA